MPSIYDIRTVFEPRAGEDELVMEQGEHHLSRVWNMGTTCSKASLLLPQVFPSVRAAAANTSKGFRFHTKSRDLGLAQPSLFKP